MNRAMLTLAVLLVLSGMLFAQDWIYPIEVHSGDRANMSTIHFGVDYRASDCFDSLGLDIPYIPSPWGYGAYFVPPCTDGLPPGMDYLAQDCRSSFDGVDDWVVQVTGDPSVNPRLIKWDIETLPVVDTTEELFGSLALAGYMWIGQRKREQ